MSWLPRAAWRRELFGDLLTGGASCMCGIAGIVSTGGGRVDPRQLHAMAESLRHRGPDDEGYLLIGAAGTAAEECRGSETIVERGFGLHAVTDATDTPYAVGLAHR